MHGGVRQTYLSSYLKSALLVAFRGDAAVLGERERRLLQLSRVMVEDEIRVESASFEHGFEVEMFGCGASGASGETYHMTGFHLVAHLHEVFRLVRVECLQSVGVLDDDAESVAVVRVGACHHAVECCHYLVVRFRL